MQGKGYKLVFARDHALYITFDFLYRLDYPGVGPEHSFLKEKGRAEYFSVTDEEALEGIENCVYK